jgi:hypothetical protein
LFVLLLLILFVVSRSYLFEICNYYQITSPYPINYNEVINVNIVIRRCQYNYKTMQVHGKNPIVRSG